MRRKAIWDASSIRFSVFEFDASAAVLRKRGAKLRLEGQPLQVLAILLERPGQVVTREQLKARLWPSDTFVDFDHSINSAIKRLRQALDDSAATPRFIETVRRRGYRFICPVDQAPLDPRQPPTRRTLLWAGLTAVAVLSLTVALNVGGLRDRLLGTGFRTPVGSVAVLPFENLTGDAGQEYLADGVTDALITELAQVKPLAVTSLTSAMSYKPGKKCSWEIARDLSVEACVEGSVQRVGERVQLSIQLVHGRSNRRVWASHYAGDTRGLPQLVYQIACDLVGHMKVQLAADQQARLAKVRTLNPKAYDAYLAGRYSVRKRTEAGTAEAQKYFSRAIDIDPGFAQAYCQLALMYSHGST